MDVAVAVGVRDLLVIDLAEPVVGGDGAGVGQDQSADGIGDGGVFLHAPVLDVQVLVDGILIVKVGGFHVAQFLALLAVEDVGLGHILVSAAGEDGLHAVLDVLDSDLAVTDLRQEVRRDLQRQKVDDAVVILGLGRVERLLDGVRDLVDVKVDDLAVSFYYFVHILILLCLQILSFFSLYTPRTSTEGTIGRTASQSSCISFSPYAPSPSSAMMSPLSLNCWR